MEQTLSAFHDTPVAAFAGQPETSRQTAQRHDIYAIIHKALRAAMTDALLAAGRLDAGDSREVTDTVVRVNALLELCKHLRKKS